MRKVKSSEVKKYAKVLLDFCNDNDVDIMQLQDFIFDDFSITHKISIAQLTKMLNTKFGIEFEGAELLARYAIEQDNHSKDYNSNDNNDEEYEFDANRNLSHAKVISRLQSVITNIMIHGE